MTDTIGPYIVNLLPEERLGEGSFGYVCKATHKDTGVIVAGKCIAPKGTTFDWDRVQNELKTITAASDPGHENILNIIDHYEKKGSSSKVLWIFTDLCELGDMNKYARIYDLKVSHKLNIMHQVISGLAYLHNHKPYPIVHRDIKPDNVLFSAMDGCHNARLCDFGVSKVIETACKSYLSTLAGTRPYMAPELVKDPNSAYHDSVGYVDLFSCGIMFYQLIQAQRGMGLDVKEVLEGCLGMKIWERRYKKWNPIDIKDKEPEEVKNIKYELREMVCVVASTRKVADKVVIAFKEMLENLPEKPGVPDLLENPASGAAEESTLVASAMKDDIIKDDPESLYTSSENEDTSCLEDRTDLVQSTSGEASQSKISHSSLNIALDSIALNDGNEDERLILQIIQDQKRKLQYPKLPKVRNRKEARIPAILCTGTDHADSFGKVPEDKTPIPIPRHSAMKAKAKCQSWPKGTVVFSQYPSQSYSGTHEHSVEYLTYQKNELFTIESVSSNPLWYFAVNDQGKTGLILKHHVKERECVELMQMPWFHGNLSRIQSEELLGKKIEGRFLIRNYVNLLGEYTLSLVGPGNHGYREKGPKVEHYHIMTKSYMLTIDEDKHFNDLCELVEHHEKEADGLCSKLSHPVTHKGKIHTTMSKKPFIQNGWSLDIKDFDLGNLVSQNNFVDIYEGFYHRSRKPVTLRKLKEFHDSTILFSEAAVMTGIEHDNIAKFHGIIVEDPYTIVQEHMKNGRLREYLQSYGRHNISRREQLQFAQDVCNALQYLESQEIIHGELSTKVVGVFEGNVAKLFDLRIARPKDMFHPDDNIPPKWKAPEALHGNFSMKSDVWSFGVLLWEIYSFGRDPYLGISGSAGDFAKRLERGYCMEMPDECPLEIQTVIRATWDIKADRRPTFREIKLVG